MEIETRKERGALIVSVSGRLDANTASELDGNLDYSLEKGVKNLIFDLSALDYISSAGLRVILASGKRIKKAQGDLILVGLKGNVKKIFDLSGFTSIFRVLDTVEEALGRS